MSGEIAEVKGNLFPASDGAIADWAKFPWHRDRSNRIQAHKPPLVAGDRLRRVRDYKGELRPGRYSRRPRIAGRSGGRASLLA